VTAYFIASTIIAGATVTAGATEHFALHSTVSASASVGASLSDKAGEIAHISAEAYFGPVFMSVAHHVTPLPPVVLTATPLRVIAQPTFPQQLSIPTRKT
jgi:hypothetical protein